MSAMADENTRRLTLILSGAVSLGAYEGGVVSQIAYALAKWNEARPDQPPLAVIDVIAGASAGSMTGAMLAFHLSKGTEPEAFVDQVRESWCGKGTTLREMVKQDPGDQHSFFSSSSIDRIAAAFFGEQRSDPARVRQKEVLFTCTVTALDAIPYKFMLLTRHALKEVDAWTCQDWITFSFAPDPAAPVVELPSGRKRGSLDARAVDWPRVVSVAVASGAFPVAFQPMQVSRKNSDYPKPLKEQGGWSRMRYTDGGVLNNMPFKRAADALGCFMERSLAEHRLHVLIEVAPFRYTAGQRPVEAEVRPASRDDSPQGTLGAVVGATFSAMRQQSLYADLSTSQEVNRRLSWRDRFLYPSLAAAANGEADPAATTAEVRKGLEGYLAERSRGIPDPSLNVGDQLAHYRALAETAGTALHDAWSTVTEDRRELFLIQAALLNHLSGLHNKCPIRVERIGPKDPSKLAGEGLGAFAGFLDQDLTRHDFLCGLHDGFAWLKEWAAAESWPEPTPVDWYPREPRGRALADREVREFPDRLLEEASDLAIRRGVAFAIEELGVKENLFTRAAEGTVSGILDAVISFHGHPEIPESGAPGTYHPGEEP